MRPPSRFVLRRLAVCASTGYVSTEAALRSAKAYGILVFLAPAPARTVYRRAPCPRLRLLLHRVRASLRFSDPTRRGPYLRRDAAVPARPPLTAVPSFRRIPRLLAPGRRARSAPAHCRRHARLDRLRRGTRCRRPRWTRAAQRAHARLAHHHHAGGRHSVPHALDKRRAVPPSQP